MALVSKNIPNFINGVSQQPPALRLAGQGEIQENGLSDVVDGLKKRPATNFKKTMRRGSPSSADTIPEAALKLAFIHTYQRSVEEQYTCLFIPQHDNSVSPIGSSCPKLYVYDINGNLRHESGIGSWDSSGNPIAVPTNSSNGDKTDTIISQQQRLQQYMVGATKDQVAATSVSDHTFFVNKTTVVTRSTTPDNVRPHEGIFYLKIMNYGKKYRMRVRLLNANGSNGSLISGYLKTNAGNDPSDVFGLRTGVYFDVILDPNTTVNVDHYQGAGDFDQIASSEFTNQNLVTDRGDEEPICVVRSTTTNHNGFKMEVVDNNGGNDFFAHKDAVEKFTNLPRFCVDGFVIQVQGDSQKKEDDFYVKFVGENTTGTWQECEAPSRPNNDVSHRLISYSMPHILTQNSNESFSFTPAEWDHRKAGDDNTNPFPSFLGNTINDIFFHRNRLGFLSDENVIFSEASNYFNFFRVTVRSLLDTAPIDVGVSQNEVSILKHAVPFQQQLLMFSDLNQFSLGSDTLLTPSEVAIDTATQFECDLAAKPAAAGKTVFFATKGTNFSGIREYVTDVDLETNDAPSITAHIPSYIEGNVKQMEASSNEDMLVVRTDANLKELYIYKWYEPDKERLQSAWSKWIFDSDVIHVKFNNSRLFVVFADGRFEIINLDSTITTTATSTQIVLSDVKFTIATATYSASNGHHNGTDKGYVAQGVTTSTGGNEVIDTPLTVTPPNDDLYNANVYEYSTGVYKHDIIITRESFVSSGLGSDLSMSDLPNQIVIREQGGNDEVFNIAPATTNDTAAPIGNTFSVTLNVGTVLFSRYITQTEYNSRYVVDTNATPNRTYVYHRFQDTVTLTAQSVTGADVLVDHLTLVQGSTINDLTGLQAFYTPTANTLFVDHENNVVASGNSDLSALYTYLDGTHTNAAGQAASNYVFAGEKYNFKYQLSEQVFRPAQNDTSQIARFQLKQIHLHFNDTGDFDVTVESTGRDPKVTKLANSSIGQSDNIIGFQPLIESGTLPVGIQSQAKETKITITNDTHQPCVFQNAEWEGQIELKGERI
jgi:hypothetical protein